VPREPEAASSPVKQRLRRLQKRIIAEPWRVMTLVWQAMRAALLPVRLRDIPAALERFLANLGRRSAGPRMRRAALFYQHIQEESG